MKKFIFNQKIIATLLMFFILVYLILHLLILSQIVPYELLWGNAITSHAALIIAEQFAICFILLSVLGVVFSSRFFSFRPWFMTNIFMGFEVLYMFLNFIGCLLGEMNKGWGFYTLFLALLGVWLVYLDANAEKRKKMRRLRAKHKATKVKHKAILKK